MTDFQRIWNWYSRESVQKVLIEVARNREVVSVFKDSRFGKRPDIIQYPQDVVQSVAEGTISFHGSVERWHQPMKLDVGLSKQELDSLRSGWDVIIDPDVDDFEIAKIATKQISEVLKDHGVSNVSVKFSGGSSFHLGIPFESLPEKINFQPVQLMYTDLQTKIIEYLKWYMKGQLKEELLSLFTVEEIAQKVKKSVSDIISSEGLEPFKIVSMDIFGSRHLFRLPYSVHESTLLVSLPMRIENIDKFDKSDAIPEKVKVEEKFLIPKRTIHDAEGFVIEAMDWASKYKIETREEIPKPVAFRKVKAIPEELFPPCIQHILNKGLTDGKKRAVFILVNFLRNMGWDLERIEKKMMEWNEKNYPPLRANYLRGQLRWHFRQDRTLLPPNCDNPIFYQSIGVFSLCEQLHKEGVKNPINYPFRRLRQIKKK